MDYYLRSYFSYSPLTRPEAFTVATEELDHVGEISTLASRYRDVRVSDSDSSAGSGFSQAADMIPCSFIAVDALFCKDTKKARQFQPRFSK